MSALRLLEGCTDKVRRARSSGVGQRSIKKLTGHSPLASR